jgi:hypothetical protein
MPKFLTTDQIAQYHRDGFLSPLTLFSEDEAADIRRELEAAEGRWPEALTGAGRNNAHLTLKCLDEIVHHPVLLDAIEDIIGPDILAYGSVLFIKEPQDPGFVSWHQDCRYMGLEPHDVAVSAWLALTPSNAVTGCMSMIPGSHKHGVMEHVDTFSETNILTRGQSIEGIDEAAAVDLILEPGQFSLHSMRTVHGSRPNLGDDRRIGFTIQCYMTPQMHQTISPTMAQLVRGEDPSRHFEYAPRPDGDMTPAAIAARERNNAQWAEILYAGAERRRDY